MYSTLGVLIGSPHWESSGEYMHSPHENSPLGSLISPAGSPHWGVWGACTPRWGVPTGEYTYSGDPPLGRVYIPIGTPRSGVYKVSSEESPSGSTYIPQRGLPMWEHLRAPMQFHTLGTPVYGNAFPYPSIVCPFRFAILIDMLISF
jgi:hypothetical protein